MEQLKKSEDEDLEKAAKMPIGTVHNGYKKVAEGKWMKVSKQGMTISEHHNKSVELQGQAHKSLNPHSKDKLFKESIKHQKHSSKLSDKEYSDEEVEGKNK